MDRLHQECLEQMASDPTLTDEEKRELLLQLQLTDDEWKPIDLGEGAEPVSLTVINSRRGNEA